MPATTRFLLLLLAFFAVASSAVAQQSPSRPNVLWIYVDDMSDWLGCYGDPIAQTPAIDALASKGVRFENAFMPAPVCSTTRSALITGTMQTTHGLHHHRTMIKEPLPESIRTVPELFRDAGYVTFNEAKEDYNFTRDRSLMYTPDFKRPKAKGHVVGTDFSWLGQLKGRAFFGQIQLKGGKIGGETGSKFPAESRFDPADVVVPPQYPDHPVIRNAIARHHEQIAQTDEQVGAIVEALKEFDLWDNTVVFFFTDHGCPLPRAKQFLYEDGLKVPLIVRAPKNLHQVGEEGSTRTDLANGIDITTTSLAIAGIEVPKWMEGVDLFAAGHKPQSHVIGARDRNGIAVDRIRSIRTNKFRYIRNYMTDRALYQSNYRDNYATFKTLGELLEDGKLSSLQASYHDTAARPAEELYLLADDPHQLKNLADDPKYASALNEHRKLLNAWEKKTGDQGRFPESKESLELVYRGAKGKAPAPEFDFLRK